MSIVDRNIISNNKPINASSEVTLIEYFIQPQLVSVNGEFAKIPHPFLQSDLKVLVILYPGIEIMTSECDGVDVSEITAISAERLKKSALNFERKINTTK